jgi:hypothetical protein
MKSGGVILSMVLAMTDPLPFDPFAAVSLTAADRVSSPDFPGVLRWISADWRLVISMKCDKFILQERCKTSDGATVWIGQGRGRRSLVQLVSDFGDKLDGLALACDGIPDDPSQAFPAFAAALADLLDCFEAHRVCRHDYGRVILQDGNLRLAVDASGDFYRLQWCYIADMHAQYKRDFKPYWKSICISPSLDKIRQYIDVRCFDTNTKFSDVASQPCPTLYASLKDLPPLAALGVWPSLPAIP